MHAAFAALKTYRAGQDNAPLFVLESFANRVSNDPAQRTAAAERFAVIAGDPQTGDDARLFAVKQLKLLAGDAQAPLLARLLDDPKTADAARLALQTLPGTRAGEALLAALDRLQGTALAGVVNSLGTRREANAVPKLTPLLGHRDAVVVTAALRALGSIGTSDAANSLAAFKPTPQTEAAWFDALLVAASNLAASQSAQAYALCEQVWKSTTPAAPKPAALAGLVRANVAQAMPALLESLRSPEVTLRGTAAHLVAGLKDPSQLNPFAAVLPQLSPDTQALLCDAFAANGDRTLLGAVLPLVSNDNEATRLAAIAAVGRLGGPANLETLLQLAGSDPASVRSAARKALSVLAGAEVDPRLIALTTTGATGLRVEAIRALATRNARVAPALFTLATDNDPAVQRAAIEALGSLVTPADYPRLVSALVAQAGAPASQAAVEAVVAAGKRVPDRPQRVKPVVEAFAAASPAAKIALLEVLGSFGGSEALSAVTAALKHDDAAVRGAALETLAEWPDASAAKALLAAAQSADSEAHRAQAWGGYVRLALAANDQTAPLFREAGAAATTPTDRQALLAALSAADKPAALTAITVLVGEPAIADEAVKIALTLARKFARSDNEAAVTVAERVMQVARDPALLAQARDFLARQGAAAQPLGSAPYGSEVIAARKKEIAAQLPAGDTLLAYLDAGVETQSTGTGGPAIRQLNGKGWSFSEAGKATPQETIAFDGRRLSFELAGLDPKKQYAVAFTWTDADSGGRSASVDVLDGETFQPKPALPQTKLPAGAGNFATVQLPLAPAACASGKARVALNHLSGPNVVAGEVWLVETKPGSPTATKPVLTSTSAPAPAAAKPAAPADLTPPSEGTKVLIVTGDDYPGHPWQQTAPTLRALLEKDPRLKVRIVEDPNALASPKLKDWDVVIIHFMDWEKPGPGPEARENLRQFVASGKGMMLTHFACGAWDGDEWPEFKALAGRVWFGPNGGRQHDPRGKFTVNIADPEHPITKGMAPFETDDELYTCLMGDAPIHVVAQATSKVDQKDYPMVFVLDYGKGRVFHTVLGHDARAYASPGVGELMRRGCAWAASLGPQPKSAP